MTWASINDVHSFVSDAYSEYWSYVDQFADAGRLILLVEGDDDVRVLEQVLRQRDRAAAGKVHVAATQGWVPLLKKLKAHSDWWGIVDRDTREPGEVRDLQREFGDRLLVTEGWCLEELFCRDRAELARAVGKTRAEIDPVYADLDAWLDYGSIWHVFHRQRERVRTEASALDYRAFCPSTQQPRTLAAVADVLQGFQLRGIDSDHLVRQIDQFRRAGAGQTEAARILRALPAKEFFVSQLVPGLNRLDLQHQQEAADWRLWLAERWSTWPAWLTDFCQEVLAKTR